MRLVLRAVLVCVALLFAAGIGLFLGTRPDDPVTALVTQDTDRPSQEIAGLTLHLQVSDGPPAAQTILVLHGGPGGDFRSLLALDALSETHRVVFYDQRGAGLSQRVDESRLTLDGYLEELHAVGELVSPDAPVVLIGHSWGAMLATAYLGQFPDRVARAVLIEPGYLDAPGRAAWQARAQGYQSGLSYMTEAVLTGFRAAHVTGPDAQAADDFLIGHMVGVFAGHPDNPYHCGQGYTAPSWRFGALASSVWMAAPDAEMARISAGTGFDGEVLLLAGACNDWTGEPLQARHAARFPNARLVVIPEAGHDVIWDNPEASLAAIRPFLTGRQ